MPYAVKKVKGGYKVQNTITKRFFSKDQCISGKTNESNNDVRISFTLKQAN